MHHPELTRVRSICICPRCGTATKRWRQAERESYSYARHLRKLVRRECEERQKSRTARMLRE